MSNNKLIQRSNHAGYKKSIAIQGGFTLVELLLTVGIVGILTSIAIPTFNEYRAKAYDAQALSLQMSFYTAVESWMGNDFDGNMSATTGWFHTGDGNNTFTGEGLELADYFDSDLQSKKDMVWFLRAVPGCFYGSFCPLGSAIQVSVGHCKTGNSTTFNYNIKRWAVDGTYVDHSSPYSKATFCDL